MSPDAQRRRPRARPPAPAESHQDAPRSAAEDAPAARRNPFGIVWWAAAVIVVAVIVVAFATGTADELPWGAIIGVLAVLAFAYVAGRRRRMALRDEDDAG
jgi:LPXTG-motif cell wall-anchored protein